MEKHTYRPPLWLRIGNISVGLILALGGLTTIIVRLKTSGFGLQDLKTLFICFFGGGFTFFGISTLRNFRSIVELAPDSIRVRSPNSILEIPLENIKKHKIVTTDGGAPGGITFQDVALYDGSNKFLGSLPNWILKHEDLRKWLNSLQAVDS